MSAWLVDHEYRHVEHWTFSTALGAAIIVILKLTLGVSLWYLPLALLTFPLLYFVSFVDGGHEGSFFEHDADSYANRVHGTDHHQHR